MNSVRRLDLGRHWKSMCIQHGEEGLGNVFAVFAQLESGETLPLMQVPERNSGAGSKVKISMVESMQLASRVC